MLVAPPLRVPRPPRACPLYTISLWRASSDEVTNFELLGHHWTHHQVFTRSCWLLRLQGQLLVKSLDQELSLELPAWS